MIDDDEDVVLEVRNVSKRFCRSLRRGMVYGAFDMGRSLLHLPPKQTLRPGEFMALQDISFTLRRGETYGLVGRNGCGKSTLLRIINGIFPPDAGEIKVKGRMGALIAVGAGFHPQMTGAENVYLNGTILGMSKAEITARYREIVEFAELGDFMDAPISTYSSGMVVRLGFSIAVHADIDVLLADEVLSVGDVFFQKKCMDKMRELSEKGMAIVFVSHSSTLVESLCNNALYIKKGVSIEEGSVDKVVARYLEDTAATLPHAALTMTKTFPIHDHVDFLFRSISMAEIPGIKRPVATFDLNDTLTLLIDYQVNQTIKNLYISLAIRREGAGELPVIYSLDADDSPEAPAERHAGVYKYAVSTPLNALSPGRYMVDLVAHFYPQDRVVGHSECLAFTISDFNARKERISHGASITGIAMKWTRL